MMNVDEVILENVLCPLGCKSNDEIVLVGRDMLHNLPGEFSIVRCRNCGLMRTDPRPTSETIGFYYPRNYGPYKTTDGASSCGSNASSVFKKKVRKLLGFETRNLPMKPPGNLVEIGSASGAYLLKMRQEGWKVEGIELSEVAAKRAQSDGLMVQVSTVESAVEPCEKADIIAAWMVLEHLYDPIGVLKKIRSWVKPSGYLVASIPDADSLIRRAFGNKCYDLHLPNHLYHYTPETLARLLEDAGWDIVRIKWQYSCTTLLWSAEYLAHDKAYSRLESFVRWLRTAKRAREIRFLLNWLLGITRQSGRIEVWARPVSDDERLPS